MDRLASLTESAAFDQVIEITPTGDEPASTRNDASAASSPSLESSSDRAQRLALESQAQRTQRIQRPAQCQQHKPGQYCSLCIGLD